MPAVLVKVGPAVVERDEKSWTSVCGRSAELLACNERSEHDRHHEAATEGCTGTPREIHAHVAKSQPGCSRHRVVAVEVGGLIHRSTMRTAGR